MTMPYDPRLQLQQPQPASPQAEQMSNDYMRQQAGQQTPSAAQQQAGQMSSSQQQMNSPMGEPTRIDHTNKSYRFADGGTVQADGQPTDWRKDPDMTSVFGEYGMERRSQTDPSVGATIGENRKFASVTDPKTGAFVYRKDLSPERLQSQSRLMGQAEVNKGKGSNQ